MATPSDPGELEGSNQLAEPIPRSASMIVDRAALIESEGMSADSAGYQPAFSEAQVPVQQLVSGEAPQPPQQVHRRHPLAGPVPPQQYLQPVPRATIPPVALATSSSRGFMTIPHSQFQSQSLSQPIQAQPLIARPVYLYKPRTLPPSYYWPISHTQQFLRQESRAVVQGLHPRSLLDPPARINPSTNIYPSSSALTYNPPHPNASSPTSTYNPYATHPPHPNAPRTTSTYNPYSTHTYRPPPPPGANANVAPPHIQSYYRANLTQTPRPGPRSSSSSARAHTRSVSAHSRAHVGSLPQHITNAHGGSGSQVPVQITNHQLPSSKDQAPSKYYKSQQHHQAQPGLHPDTSPTKGRQKRQTKSKPKPSTSTSTPTPAAHSDTTSTATPSHTGRPLTNTCVRHGCKGEVQQRNGVWTEFCMRCQEYSGSSLANAIVVDEGMSEGLQQQQVLQGSLSTSAHASVSSPSSHNIISPSPFSFGEGFTICAQRECKEVVLRSSETGLCGKCQGKMMMPPPSASVGAVEKGGARKRRKTGHGGAGGRGVDVSEPLTVMPSPTMPPMVPLPPTLPLAGTLPLAARTLPLTATTMDQVTPVTSVPNQPILLPINDKHTDLTLSIDVAGFTVPVDGVDGGDDDDGLDNQELVYPDDGPVNGKAGDSSEGANLKKETRSEDVELAPRISYYRSEVIPRPIDFTSKSKSKPKSKPKPNPKPKPDPKPKPNPKPKPEPKPKVTLRRSRRQVADSRATATSASVSQAVTANVLQEVWTKVPFAQVPLDAAVTEKTVRVCSCEGCTATIDSYSTSTRCVKCVKDAWKKGRAAAAATKAKAEPEDPGSISALQGQRTKKRKFVTWAEDLEAETPPQPTVSLKTLRSRRTLNSRPEKKNSGASRVRTKRGAISRSVKPEEVDASVLDAIPAPLTQATASSVTDGGGSDNSLVVASTTAKIEDLETTQALREKGKGKGKRMRAKDSESDEAGTPSPRISLKIRFHPRPSISHFITQGKTSLATSPVLDSTGFISRDVKLEDMGVSVPVEKDNSLPATQSEGHSEDARPVPVTPATTSSQLLTSSTTPKIEDLETAEALLGRRKKRKGKKRKIDTLAKDLGGNETEPPRPSLKFRLPALSSIRRAEVSATSPALDNPGFITREVKLEEMAVSVPAEKQSEGLAEDPIPAPLIAATTSPATGEGGCGTLRLVSSSPTVLGSVDDASEVTEVDESALFLKCTSNGNPEGAESDIPRSYQKLQVGPGVLSVGEATRLAGDANDNINPQADSLTPSKSVSAQKLADEALVLGCPHIQIDNGDTEGWVNDAPRSDNAMPKSSIDSKIFMDEVTCIEAQQTRSADDEALPRADSTKPSKPDHDKQSHPPSTPASTGYCSGASAFSGWDSELSELSSSPDEGEFKIDSSESELETVRAPSVPSGLKIRLPARVSNFFSKKSVILPDYPSVPGARLCSFRNCVHILPSVSEYDWKMCGNCRKLTRRQRRATTNHRAAAKGKAAAAEHELDSDDDKMPDYLESERRPGRCVSRDCGVLLDPNSNSSSRECQQCRSRRIKELTKKKPKIGRRQPSEESIVTLSFTQYPCFLALLSGIDGFLDGYSCYAKVKAPTSPVTFGFDGEFSVVTMDFHFASRKAEVDETVIRAIEERMPLIVSPERWVANLEGGIVSRFKCEYHAKVADLPKTLMGDLEIGLSADHSHRFLKGQRTSIRLRLVG